MRSKLAWLALLPVLTPACSPPAVTPAPRDAASPPTSKEAPRAPSDRPAILGPEASAITFDRLAKFSEPGWHVPRGVAYSPDGKLLTYLASEAKDDQMALFAFDLQTKSSKVLLRASDLVKEEKPLSREEELRRERQRKKIVGVTQYGWARRAPVMLVPHGGDVFVRAESGAITRLTETPSPEIDPQICEGGEKVGFVRDGELFIIDVATRRETQLTKGAPAGVTRGLSDYVAQEEFDEPSGFWLSPDCTRLAYLEVDERQVGLHPIVGFRGGQPDLMQQRYPEAGGRNPQVRAGILDLKTRRTSWLTWPKGKEAEERYLVRFTWSPDSKSLWFQSLDREQKHLALLRADAATGATSEVLGQSSKTWIDPGELRFLERSPRFLWTTAVDGHDHLSLHEVGTGARVAQLTSGSWDVNAIKGVDEEKGQVLFTGSRDTPLENHLYVVPLAGGEPKRLTTEHSDHAVAVSRNGSGWTDMHSAVDRPPQVEIRAADGSLLGALPTPEDPEIKALRIRAPELITVRGPSGDTLHGALLKPRAVEDGKRYPVIVMVYGGPGVQTIRNGWYPRLLWQHLADRGFGVFALDNRGSSGRGPAFASTLYGRLGEVELADQLAGVGYLRSLSWVNPDRIGVYGHSYGGYMSILSMLKAPDHFRVGVAGAPVTDWRLYDTGYTERFMGLPAKNADGYKASSLIPLAPNLQGKLLLVHALMDENVHFQNSAELIDALVAADRTFDLLVLPGERHGYRTPASKRYVNRRVVDYFIEHL
ncbi:S9 family peptidase [Chondromyces crocatus]|nr:alpha/beta fold hydrolase [Chondromyces crocatus]